MSLYEDFNCGCLCHSSETNRCGTLGPCCPNAGRKTAMYEEMKSLLKAVKESKKEKEQGK